MSHLKKELYKFGGFSLDISERLLSNANGEKIALPEKVFATLCFLVGKSGSLVRKDELLEAVWDGAFVEENNLDKTISALRRALGEKRGEKIFIETVRKHGYRFVAEVERVEIEREVLTENAPVNTPPNAPAKTFDNHHYTVERRGNVLAVADWQIEPENAAAETLPQLDAADAPPEIVLPAAPVEAQPVRSPNRVAVLLIVLALLGGGLAFSVNRFSNSRWTTSQNSFEHINFRTVVGSDDGYSPTISPDGKTAAYRDSDSIIWIENLTNGSRIQLKNGDEAVKGIWLKFAPDGNYLYYVRQPDGETQNAIFRVAVPNGTPRKIVGNTWTGAAVSPDGKQIAFVRQNVEAGEHAIYTANADGTNERKIASRLSPNWFQIYGNYLAWSPDGTKLACIGGADGYQSNGVLIVNIADGAEFNVPNPEWQNGEFDELTWTADGNNLLVVAKDSVNSPSQIWLVSYPQGAWRRITNDLNNYSKVDASADGKTLITAQAKSYAQLWLMPTDDASRAAQLTDGRTYKDGNLGLSFTPDGKQMVYASSESGNYEIWTANADGSNRRQLTFGSESAAEPTVTPDNRYIVFIRTTNNSPHLWRMNVDGNDLRQLTDGKGEFIQPAITSDSRSIIYTAYAETPNTALFRVSIDGGEATRLTGKLTSSQPVVSPDGKWIAYNFYNPEIAQPWQSGVMPIEGGEPVKTFDMPLRGLMCWTRDGKSLVHLSKDWKNLWQTPVFEGGASKQITDFKTGAVFRFALSPGGKQLALSRGNTETNIVLIADEK